MGHHILFGYSASVVIRMLLPEDTTSLGEHYEIFAHVIYLAHSRLKAELLHKWL
jgi:hypothetical protein